MEVSMASGKTSSQKQVDTQTQPTTTTNHHHHHQHQTPPLPPPLPPPNPSSQQNDAANNNDNSNKNSDNNNNSNNNNRQQQKKQDQEHLHKVVIKAADMPHEMQHRAINLALTAYEKFELERDMAHYLKQQFDERFQPSWHCIVGRHFGSFVTHDGSGFLYFYIDKTAILLFRSGS